MKSSVNDMHFFSDFLSMLQELIAWSLILCCPEFEGVVCLMHSAFHYSNGAG